MQNNSFSAIGFELKEKYQRNMLMALGIVTGLALVVAVGIKYLGPLQLRDEVVSKSAQPDLTVQVAVPDDGAFTAARQSNGLNPYEKQHKGFAGFRGYTIIPDVPMLAKVKPSKVIPHLQARINVDTNLSYSQIDIDTESGEFSPETADFLPDDVDALPRRVVNREIEVIAKTPPKIPFMALENNRGGFVEVLMYVDSTGAMRPYAAVSQPLSDSSGFFLDFVMKDGKSARLRFFVDSNEVVNTCQYLVIKEEPREYGFAKNLTAVLPSWVFSPKIKDNRPVGAFVRVEFHYCDPKDEPDCVQLVLIHS